MDGMLYPVSLVVLAMLAFSFYQTHNNFLASIMLIIGIYIVYSHETGNTATDWKNEVIESIDESTRDFSKSRGTGGYDESKAGELLKNKGE